MRTVKITADVSEEAKRLLVELGKKHDRSFGWLLDRMIRKYAQPEQEKPKATRAPAKKAPENVEHCFQQLWDAKGRTGSKKEALAEWRKLTLGESPEDTQEFTNMLIEHMRVNWEKPGMEALHLKRYITQRRWET